MVAPLRLPAAAVLASIALSSPAPAAEPPHVNGILWIGTLALHFDALTWAVDGSDRRYRIACLRRECRGAVIDATIEDDESGDLCSPEAMAGRLGRENARLSMGHRFPASMTVHGLTVHTATLVIGCRNLAGDPLVACTHLAGRTYLFDAPGDGCHTWYGHADVVLELLTGLRPR